MNKKIAKKLKNKNKNIFELSKNINKMTHTQLYNTNIYWNILRPHL